MGKSKTRFAGWIAVAGLVGAALVTPATVFAQDGNQTNVSSEGWESDCTGGPGGETIQPGTDQAAFVFVHAAVDAQAGATLTAWFTSAGQQTATSYIQGGLSVTYAIFKD
jgi:uncharacterized membrane protein YdcZ (DUF606 family)